MIRYAKRGRARFASHRDFARAFERALRRAGVPMAYSSGFNPHQRISWANPAPTGMESEAEYVEIGLADPVDLAALAEVLNAHLPAGFAIIAVAPSNGERLTGQLSAAVWAVDLGSSPEALLRSAVERLLAAPEALVTRQTKNGPRLFDARGAVVSATVAGPGLHLVLLQGQPLVRPDDILSALDALEPGVSDGSTARMRRLSQGLLDPDGGITEPLPA
jgi:radical SAM-linked protein